VSQDLTGTVAQLVEDLPAEQVRMLASRLAGLAATPDPAWWSRVSSVVPTPAFAKTVDRLRRDASNHTGATLALVLLSALEVARREQRLQYLEIVWTGPETNYVPVRLTRAVLIDVIRSATGRLTLVSLAAYHVKDVCAELEAAAGRGVDVRLVLESESMDGAAAFSSLRAMVGFWVWPAARRPLLAAGHASLHAKAAVADDHTAFVTSANLTGHGIDANMELGLLVRGGAVPGRLAAHLSELMDSGTLVPVD
jgi:cardiolipin synthase A/B